MFTSFTTALSALKAHSSAVDAVGNNLANVSTAGYKSTDVSFRDLVSASMGGSSATGMGVNQPIVRRSFGQGAVQSSSGSIDAAIQGNGFFVLSGADNQQLFTLVTARSW